MSDSGATSDRATVSDPAATVRKHLTGKKIAGYAVSIIIVIAIFAFAVPKFADYGSVVTAMRTLTPVEFWSLMAATVFNLFTYWWANMAAIPGLGWKQAAVLTQTTTSVANTLPAGGAIAIGLTYSILDSWGFSGTSVALYVGVTGIWNIFAKLALPVVALAALALVGSLTPVYITAAIVGIGVLAGAVLLFVVIFRSEALARRVGEWLGRVISSILRLFRKPPVHDAGERAVQFRRDTIELVEKRWLLLTFTTLLSQIALFFVLLLSLRHMGVAVSEVGTVEAFAVYAFSRLLTAVPITPGGVGVIDLGYIGGLAAFSPGSNAEIVAAVLIFRLLTYGLQIPIGAFTYVVWRRKKDWRREAVAAPVV
jgi:putative heme transporter